MKRLLFFLAFLLPAFAMTFAAENLALQSNGATAYSDLEVWGGQVVGYLNDGDANTKWQPATYSANMSFYIDLGSEKTVNTIKINWEAVIATKFDIYTGKEVGGVINWTKTDYFVSKNEATTQTYYLANALTTQYVKFVSTEENRTDYGLTIKEFELYNEDLSALRDVDYAIATASGVWETHQPYLAIDGNTGTSWQAEQNNLSAWLLLDLKTPRTFNAVSITWGNINSKEFKLQKSDDGETFVDIGSWNNGESSLDNITKTYSLDGNVTTQFLRFVSISQTNDGWGTVIKEISTSTIAPLASVTLSVPNAARQNSKLSATKVGVPLSLTISALDENSAGYPSDGTTFVATLNGNTKDVITSAGVFTPTEAGLYTITATLEDKSDEVTVYVYDGDDLLLNKAASTNDGASNTAYFTDGNWGNRGDLGLAIPAWAQYDLGAYYTIDFVMLKQEQANAGNYTIQFSADGEEWVDAYTRTDVAGMNGDVWDYFYGNTTQNTNVRFIRFYATTAATGYGISIYEIAAYGTKTGEVEDTEAPVINTATVNATALGVTFTLKATDETATTISYTITDGGNVYNTTGASGTEITYTVYGMTTGTHSCVTVVANDERWSERLLSYRFG